MRLPAAVMAIATLAAIVVSAWASGCTDLSTNCELNLKCPETDNGPQCSGLFVPGVCDACLQESCCGELADCAADGVCLDGCALNTLPSPPECAGAQTAPLLQALADCMTTSCPTDCAPKDQCNAITINGCPPDGTACEPVWPGMFVCIPPFGPPGTPVALCGVCNNVTGPYCGGGLHCLYGSNKCARYCCADTDCGTGRCELDPMKAFGTALTIAGDAVGLCVAMDPAMGPACDAPAISPSNGSCFTGFPPM